MKLNSKHTEETKKKMSLARLGVEPINKGKKGIISEETRKKMSLAKLGKRSRRIGFKASKETLIKLRESHLGQKAWNKGKKGLQVAWNKGIKGLHLSPSTEFKKGIVPWNKGLKLPQLSGINHPHYKGWRYCGRKKQYKEIYIGNRKYRRETLCLLSGTSLCNR